MTPRGHDIRPTKKIWRGKPRIGAGNRPCKFVDQSDYICPKASLHLRFLPVQGGHYYLQRQSSRHGQGGKATLRPNFVPVLEDIPCRRRQRQNQEHLMTQVRSEVLRVSCFFKTSGQTNRKTGTLTCHYTGCQGARPSFRTFIQVAPSLWLFLVV